MKKHSQLLHPRFIESVVILTLLFTIYLITRDIRSISAMSYLR